jgi:hypothetical protein
VRRECLRRRQFAFIGPPARVLFHKVPSLVHHRDLPQFFRLTARPPDRLFRLVLESHDGRAPGADSEEKHVPVSDIDTVVVDS